MTIEERIKALILSRYGTLKDFAIQNSLNYTTIDAILRRGLNKASINNVIMICKALSISVDELAEGKIVPVQEDSAPLFEPVNINEVYELLKKQITENRQPENMYLILDEKELSYKESKYLLEAVESAIRALRIFRGNM